MDYNLLERTILDAISRGDVELLIALYKDSNGVNKGEELQELIDNNVPVIASRNGIRAGPMPFKNFVIDIYDIDQAQKAYDKDTVNEYLDNGGVAQAKSLAKVLADISHNINYISNNIDLGKLAEALAEVLMKLKGEYNMDVGVLSISPYTRLLVRELLDFGNYDSLEFFLKYPSALAAFTKLDTPEDNVAKNTFYKYYVYKYYLREGVNALENVRKYLKEDQKYIIVSLADLLLRIPGITAKEKLELQEFQSKLL